MRLNRGQNNYRFAWNHHDEKDLGWIGKYVITSTRYVGVRSAFRLLYCAKLIVKIKNKTILSINRGLFQRKTIGSSINKNVSKKKTQFIEIIEQL